MLNRFMIFAPSRVVRTRRWLLACSILLTIIAVPALAQAPAPRPSVNLPPELSALRLPDEGSFAFIELQAARAKFRVDGSGLGVAIVSSGINIRHKSFAEGKILAARNFSGSQENEDVRDESGEGSGLAATVAGLPLSNFRGGIAPGAGIVAVKVFGANGEGATFEQINHALQWLKANRRIQGRVISVILLGFGTGDNFKDPTTAIGAQEPFREMATIIRELRRERIAVVASAGSSYAEFAPAQGMAFPAICPETVSAGAVYDRDIPREGKESLFPLPNGRAIFSARAGLCVGFSQRLGGGPNGGNLFRTDIFAPGFLITSAAGSAASDPEGGLAVQSGTDQAAAHVAGVILLLQQQFRELTRNFPTGTDNLPEVSWIEEALGKGGVEFVDRNDDGGGPIDDVPPTGEKFVRLDALRALEFVQSRYVNDVRKIQLDLLRRGETKGGQRSFSTKYPENAKVLGIPIR